MSTNYSFNTPPNFNVGLILKHPDEPGALLTIFNPYKLDPLFTNDLLELTIIQNEQDELRKRMHSFTESKFYSQCMKRPWDVVSLVDEENQIFEFLEAPNSLPTQFHWSHQLPSLHYVLFPSLDSLYFNQLQYLNLSNNTLLSLPLSLFTLTQLSELNLSYNQVSVLSPLIGCLVELEELHLNSNHLTTLPSTLGFCKKLKILDVSFNLLSFLPASLIVHTSLKKLWVDQNRFYDALTFNPASSSSPMLYPSLSSPPRLAQLAFQAVATHVNKKGPHAYCRHAPNTRYTASMTKHLLHQLKSSKEFADASKRTLEHLLMGLIHSQPFDPSLLSEYLYGIKSSDSSLPSTTLSTPSIPLSSFSSFSSSTSSTSSSPPVPTSKSKYLVPPSIQTHVLWGISTTAPMLSPQFSSCSSPLSTPSPLTPPSAYAHFCLFQILPTSLLWSLFLPHTFCSCCYTNLYLLPSLTQPLTFGTIHACPPTQFLPIVHELCGISCWNRITHDLWKQIKRVKPSP